MCSSANSFWNIHRTEQRQLMGYLINFMKLQTFANDCIQFFEISVRGCVHGITILELYNGRMQPPQNWFMLFSSSLHFLWCYLWAAAFMVSSLIFSDISKNRRLVGSGPKSITWCRWWSQLLHVFYFLPQTNLLLISSFTPNLRVILLDVGPAVFVNLTIV